MQLSLNAHSSLPLVDQIVVGVRTLIDDRMLRAGMRLPPIRRFAESHEVSRFTVVEAYDRLVALGYVQSRRGSGFYVAPRTNASPVEPRRGEIERAFDNAGVLYQCLDGEATRLKVGAGWLPTDWFDEAGIRRNIRTLVRADDSTVVGYGTAQGFRPLREQLQVILGEMGIAADPSQIVLTTGATHALDLLARYLLKAGDCALVDDPGYWNLFSNLRLYGINLIGVPRTPDGPDVVALEKLLSEHRPKVFFTQSVLHNPTACNLTPATAFRLLQLAEKHNFIIVEDDIYAEFHPGTTTLLAELDQLQRVVYIGSFSKTLSASLRVGYLAANPDLAGELMDVKIVSCLSTSEFAEHLVYLMLTEGHYRKFTERTRGRLADATSKTLRMLERSGMKVYAEPEGGMFVWAEVPGIPDSVHLAELASQSDIMLAPGNIFRPQMQPSPWMRFNVAHAADPRLERFFGETLGKDKYREALTRKESPSGRKAATSIP